MKSETVVVESLEISNLYIKNKEIMNGIICTDFNSKTINT